MTRLTRYDPFMKLQKDLDKLFRLPFDLPNLLEGEGEDLGVSEWYPRMDVVEKDKEILVKMDLPGMEEKNINISVEGNILTISGERKMEKKEERENYHRIERLYGEFSRSLTLPNSVEVDKINAKYKNGVLEVSLPKKEEAKPKKISIKVEK